MWVLDSDGDFLNGKRVWLRPGKRYLFGRPQQDRGVHHQIPHKSISRQHIVVEVSSVKDRDGTRPYARTQITVIDLDSKYGTWVNENQIHGAHTLTGDDNCLRLARYPHNLRIKWEPVVLSFSFSSKEMRAEDPLAKVRSRLEDLDIKTIIPYLVDQTTHVVQSKRNTAKGLQALINGKYIVDYSYVDALVYASTPHDLEIEESPSPLETDYDAAWPSAMDHLPPAGNEPVSRPAEAFAPNPSRISVFEHYTFVFGDVSQFENLQAAINNGQGKALLYQVEDGVTSAADIVRFMRQASGGQGVGSDRVSPGGVVLVRFRSKGKYEAWSIELGNEVALMIDQRVIEQREFLDAILGNNASPLCRPLPVEEGPSQASDLVVLPTVPETNQPEVTKKSVPSVSPHIIEPVQVSPSRVKVPRVRQFVSKMKTFDDGFDMESVPVYAPDDDDQDSAPPMGYESRVSQVSQFDQPAVNVDRDAESDIVSDLLPGARAMKRRLAEMDGRSQGSNAAPAAPEAIPKPKRARLDVLEAVRKHRQEEEQQRQTQDDQLSLRNINVEELKNLAIVEEMELPIRHSLERKNESSDRWDERWNGRKNFKRFRPKGEQRYGRERVRSVIVPLEEVTRKELGIGVHYWSSNRKSSQGEDGQTERNEERSVSQPNQSPSQAGLSVAASATSEPTPALPPSLSRSHSQKRSREVCDSDSDEELRFRFRHKR